MNSAAATRSETVAPLNTTGVVATDQPLGRKALFATAVYPMIAELKVQAASILDGTCELPMYGSDDKNKTKRFLKGLKVHTKTENGVDCLSPASWLLRKLYLKKHISTDSKQMFASVLDLEKNRGMKPCFMLTVGGGNSVTLWYCPNTSSLALVSLFSSKPVLVRQFDLVEQSKNRAAFMSLFCPSMITKLCKDQTVIPFVTMIYNAHLFTTNYRAVLGSAITKKSTRKRKPSTTSSAHKRRRVSQWGPDCIDRGLPVEEQCTQCRNPGHHLCKSRLEVKNKHTEEMKKLHEQFGKPSEKQEEKADEEEAKEAKVDDEKEKEEEDKKEEKKEDKKEEKKEKKKEEKEGKEKEKGKMKKRRRKRVVIDDSDDSDSETESSSSSGSSSASSDSSDSGSDAEA